MYYSADYGRMKKRTCHAILFRDDDDGSMMPASVLYYIHNARTLNVYAVLEKFEICQAPKALLGMTPHFMWVRKAR